MIHKGEMYLLQQHNDYVYFGFKKDFNLIYLNV